MNTQILKKCLAELESVPARIDYVKGMLETLIEMQDEPMATKIYKDTNIHPITGTVGTSYLPTIAMMEAMGARGREILNETIQKGQIQ